MVLARQNWLHSWNINARRGRFDYECDEHTIEEMMNASYFGAIHQALKEGDVLYITDAKQDRVTVEIDQVDAANRMVWFSVIEKVESKPITAVSPIEDSGLAIKWRGPRGGMFCIVDKTGAVLKSDLRNKEEATRALTEYVAKKEAA